MQTIFEISMPPTDVSKLLLWKTYIAIKNKNIVGDFLGFFVHNSSTFYEILGTPQKIRKQFSLNEIHWK